MTLADAFKLGRILLHRDPARPRLWARTFVALPEHVRRVLFPPFLLRRA